MTIQYIRNKNNWDVIIVVGLMCEAIPGQGYIMLVDFLLTIPFIISQIDQSLLLF